MKESLPNVLLAAYVLVLVFGDTLPLMAPHTQRRVFQTLARLPDEKLRVISLVSMATGLTLLRLLHRQRISYLFTDLCRTEIPERDRHADRLIAARIHC